MRFKAQLLSETRLQKQNGTNRAFIFLRYACVISMFTLLDSLLYQWFTTVFSI